MFFSFIPWSADAFSSPGDAGDSSLQLVYNSDILIDAVKPFGGFAYIVAKTESEDPKLFFGPRNAFEFDANAEYTLSFSAACRKQVPGFLGKMEVYLVGSAFPVQDANSLGQKIATYTCNSGVIYQPFDTTDWNFDVLTNGIGYLRFVVYAGSWNVSDVSLKPASEFGFTPDKVELVIPIVGHQQEHLEFTIEMYDINNNLVLV